MENPRIPTRKSQTRSHELITHNSLLHLRASYHTGKKILWVYVMRTDCRNQSNSFGQLERAVCVLQNICCCVGTRLDFQADIYIYIRNPKYIFHEPFARDRVVDTTNDQRENATLNKAQNIKQRFLGHCYTVSFANKTEWYFEKLW